MADEWSALCVALVATADLSSDLVSNIGHLTVHTLSLRTEPPRTTKLFHTRGTKNSRNSIKIK